MRSQFIASVELIAIFIGLIVIDHLWFKGDIYEGMKPHPFWFPVVLVSAQYGIRGGLLASLFATVLFIMFGAPHQSGALDFQTNAANLLSLPAQWFLCSLTLGSIRSLQIFHTDMLTQEKNDTVAAAEIVSDALEKAIHEIERLELCIAGEQRTVSMILKFLSNLDVRGPVEMMRSFAPVIGFSLGGPAFSIYHAVGAQLLPICGMSKGDSRTLTSLPPLSDALIHMLHNHGVYSIREDKENEPLLPPGVIYALAITNQETKMLFGVILFDGLGQMQDPVLTLSRLRQLCDLLAILLSRFERHVQPRVKSSPLFLRR